MVMEEPFFSVESYTYLVKTGVIGSPLKVYCTDDHLLGTWRFISRPPMGEALGPLHGSRLCLRLSSPKYLKCPRIYFLCNENEVNREPLLFLVKKNPPGA